MSSLEPAVATAHLGGSLAEALTAIGQALQLPHHYGRNLDALADCLTDLDDPTTLVLSGWQQLAWEAPEDWSRLRAVLDGRARNRLEGIQGSIELPAFRVVAAGGSPEAGPRP